MTTTSKQPAQYLSSNQEELLLTALASNRPKSHNTLAKSSTHKTHSDNMRSAEMNGTMFTPDLSASGTLDNFELQNTPYMGYVDGDTSFDNLDDSELIGAYPDEFNGHEKRKNSDLDLDTDDERGGDLKRKEGDDKQAKKPGRKPLTSEPTTKRKAQNRAAQRAFRERKEQHLKDLETKVNELTKSSEADKQENGLLRAQVERLQTELRDYRKRLSSDASKNRSPPAYAATANEPSRNYFAFDFPAFGNLPGVQLPSTSNQALSNGNGSTSVSPSGTHRPSTAGQSNSGQQQLRHEESNLSNYSNRSNSINNNTVGIQSNASNKSTNEVDSFAGLFSPSILNGAKFGTENNDYGFPAANSPTVQPQNTMQGNGTETNSGLSRVFRFNSASVSSNNDSPSQSSMSQFNTNSSCNTSPESSHPSPPKELNQSYLLDPQTTLLGNSSNMNAFTAPSPGKGIDWLAAQNGGQFDPLLFGDYRESQDAIIGDGDFNNGFFNDAFPYDFGSPLNFDISSPKVQQQQPAQPSQTQAQAQPASKKCLASAEKIREGVDDDYGLPTTQATANTTSRVKQPGDKTVAELLSANTIWNQLQNNKDFQDGKFDLDALCGELRSKAKCSESGVVVPASEVDIAFAKLSGQPGRCPTLVWPKEYIDETMNKLSGGTSNWGGMGL